MRTTLLQADLHWHLPAANRAMLEELATPLSGQTDLILLPEMFTTGFTMHPAEVAEQHPGPTLKWLRMLADRVGAAIAGSVSVKDGGAYYNRFYFVPPSVESQPTWYDKRHLFTYAGEQHVYTAGTQDGLIEYRGWRLLLRVCYDIRFPIWCRNTMGYDVLLVCANWPTARAHAWASLLPARAIENVAYTLACNRVGVDGNNHPYPGQSQALNYLGQPLATFGDTIQATTVTLDKAALHAFRAKFPVLEEGDW